MSYKVVPISAEITKETRATLVSPQYKSFAATVSTANGYGPCRSCLHVFDQGNERRIGFTFNSFDGRSSLPDPGPVYVHEHECERFEGDGIPPDLLELPIYFEAFGEESRLISRVRMQPERADAQIEEVFSDDEIVFINLRNAEAGCFIARVDRRLPSN